MDTFPSVTVTPDSIVVDGNTRLRALLKHPLCVRTRCRRRILPGQSVIKVAHDGQPLLPDTTRALHGFGHAEHATEAVRAAYALTFTEDMNWLA